MGLLGTALDIFLPVLTSMGTVILVVAEALSVNDIGNVALIMFSTFAGMFSFFFVMFYKGVVAIRLSCTSATSIVPYSGTAYANTPGVNVTPPSSAGTGAALFLLLINIIINLVVITIMFIKNLTLFLISLFIPEKRIEMNEHGYRFFEKIAETPKALLAVFGITIVINLISLILLFSVL